MSRLDHEGLDVSPVQELRMKGLATMRLLPTNMTSRGPCRSKTGPTARPTKYTMNRYVEKIHPTSEGEYSWSWFSRKYDWNTADVLMIPNTDMKRQNDPNTTPQAVRPPSGYVRPSWSPWSPKMSTCVGTTLESVVGISSPGGAGSVLKFMP